MKFYILLIILVFNFSVCFAQNDTLKVIVLNQVVEFVPLDINEDAKFQVLQIETGGKILKKISVSRIVIPQIIGTFQDIDSQYAIYRTYMGNGACAGGDLYIIKFETKFDQSTLTEKITDTEVSPVLSGCLGEFPVYSITYNQKNDLILSVSEHSINLNYLNKWIKNKPNILAEPTKKTSKIKMRLLLNFPNSF